MRSFTISTDRISPRRWCWVRVHDTAEDMVRAAIRLNPRSSGGSDRAAWDGCYGCFQPSWEDCKTAYAGTLRLVDGWVTPEIVAHELVHAACQVYRMNVHADVRLGTGCRRREEDLAYIYGELHASFAAKVDH
jgi:hypothetical protein